MLNSRREGVSPRLNRRDVLTASVAAAAKFVAVGYAAGNPPPAGDSVPISALVPRSKPGHQFLLYSDCCGGIPNLGNAANLASVNRMVARIRPEPEFIAFPGDAISGYITDYAELRRQWDHWQDVQMSWLKGKSIPLFQSTSNHNTYDDGSERVFRSVHAHLPQNGSEDQKGLAYWIRRGDLLYVSTHQPERQFAKDYRQGMQVDSRWLDRVLAENRDARFKFVAGHYPVFPVNGYAAYPVWCLTPQERKPFWDVLVKHKVDAYLTSHVIAFDVQVHAGVLQILSGGAGTRSGPGGFMPGRTEYFHSVQMAIDGLGLRYQVLDVQGQVRESLVWPFKLPNSDSWQPLTPQNVQAAMSNNSAASGILAWRLRGELGPTNPLRHTHTMICGWDTSEGAETVWVGVEGNPPRAVVRLVPESAYGSQVWTGPTLKAGSPFDFQIALHRGMGPGGVLFRWSDDGRWSSLASASSRGVEILKWPARWAFGTGQSGVTDRPFPGQGLRIDWTRVDIAAIS